MRRREILTGSLSLFALPLIGFAAVSRKYSSRAIDLVAQSNVIDMLGLLTLNWPLLDRWQAAPAAFTEDDFRKLRSSGIDVFHPAVAFERNTSHDVTHFLGITSKDVGSRIRK